MCDKSCLDVTGWLLLTNFLMSFTTGFNMVSIPYFLRYFSLVIARRLIQDSFDLAFGGRLPSVK